MLGVPRVGGSQGGVRGGGSLTAAAGVDEADGHVALVQLCLLVEDDLHHLLQLRWGEEEEEGCQRIPQGPPPALPHSPGVVVRTWGAGKGRGLGRMRRAARWEPPRLGAASGMAALRAPPGPARGARQHHQPPCTPSSIPAEVRSRPLAAPGTHGWVAPSGTGGCGGVGGLTLGIGLGSGLGSHLGDGVGVSPWGWGWEPGCCCTSPGPAAPSGRAPAAPASP